MLLLVKIGQVQDRFNSSPLKHFIMNSLFDQEMGHILNIDSNQKILQDKIHLLEEAEKRIKILES